MNKRSFYIRKLSDLGRTVTLVLICFMFLYTFIIPGLPVGTFMVVLCFLFFYTFYEFIKGNFRFERLRTTKMVRSYWLWNVFLIIYIFCLLQLFGSGNGTTPLKDYLQMLIVLPFFYFWGTRVFKNMEDLMKILYIGVIIQSFIIIVALFSPSLSIGLSLLFPEDAYNTGENGGFEETIKYGYHVGLGVYSSAGVLKMAVGQIGACYFLMKSRGGKFVFHLVLYLVISVAATVVARTGLLISVAGLIPVFITKKKEGGNQAIKYIFLFSFLLLISFVILTSYIPTDFLEDIFKRISRTIENGLYGSFFEKYSGNSGGNVIPPISLETIIGLGITNGTSGSGITTITDGGFMRNYSSMGIIVAFLNYYIIASYFIKRFKSSKSSIYKNTILFTIIVFLIGEFKEYYIYYLSPICLFFLIFYLTERDERRFSLVN